MRSPLRKSAVNIFGGQGTYQFGGYTRVPGQVPGNIPLSARPRLDPEIEASLTQKPAGVTLDRMLDRPVLRAQDAVSNLGLTKALEATLSLRIQKEAAVSRNQLIFQKAINATMLETGLPPDLAGVINARSVRFYRSTLQKSGRGELFSVAELAELKKGRPFLKPTKKGTLPENPRSAAKHEANVTKNKKVLGIKHVTESVDGEAHREFDVVKGSATSMDAVQTFTIDPQYLSDRYADPQGAGYHVERVAQSRNVGATYPKLHGKVGEKTRVKKMTIEKGEHPGFWRLQGAGHHLSDQHRSETVSGDAKEDGTSAVEGLHGFSAWLHEARGKSRISGKHGVARQLHGKPVEIVHFHGKKVAEGTDGEPIVHPHREVARYWHPNLSREVVEKLKGAKTPADLKRAGFRPSGTKAVFMGPRGGRYSDSQHEHSIQKSSIGEGSRGGKIIGHTSTGKPIYDSPSHSAHAGFSSIEHEDASSAHLGMIHEEHGHEIMANTHRHMGMAAARQEQELPHNQRPSRSVSGFTWSGLQHAHESDSAFEKAAGPKGQFQEVGGKYVAKVSKGKKVKYYYDEAKYKKEHGEHISGDQARVRHIHSEVHRIAHEAGPAGHDVTGYRELVQKHGARPVHEAVRNHVDAGSINFQGGKFSLGKKPENEKPKADKKLKKSVETFFIKR